MKYATAWFVEATIEPGWRYFIGSGQSNNATTELLLPVVRIRYFSEWDGYADLLVVRARHQVYEPNLEGVYGLGVDHDHVRFRESGPWGHVNILGVRMKEK